MISRWRHGVHLTEEALVSAYFEVTHGDTGGAVNLEHLARCEACQARYRELTALLEQVETDAQTDADLALTPERLSQQRSRIQRRLSGIFGAGVPAKVLRFPSGIHPARVADGHSPRRLGATAAAGLIVGLLAGQLVEFQPQLESLGSRIARLVPSTSDATEATEASAEPAATDVVETEPPLLIDRTPVMPVNDEEFLVELEEAMAPRCEELRFIDALTPRVIEVTALSFSGIP